MASPLGKDLIFLIMQYLDEEKFKDALHKLEQESGLFFNMRHFEELILAGKWNEIEKYLSGFTKLEDNRFSMKIYFELRKQNYLEALDNNDRSKAVDILVKDLKVFARFNGELIKDMTQLLTLDNFRENEQLASYTDTRSVRTSMAAELKRLIEANPLFRDKLKFPSIRASRLRMMVNQSLNWQHSLCPYPKQNPDIKTLYVDHSCRNSNESIAQLQLATLTPRADASFLAMGSNNFRHQSPPVVQTLLPTRGSIPVSSAHRTVSPTPPPPNALAIPAATIQRTSGVQERTLLVANAPASTPNWADEFPKTVSRVLLQESAPMCMDFHPIQQTCLLVGTNAGEISLWEASTREKLASRSFQIGLIKDQSVSVKKVLWNAEGNLFGAAFSRNAVHIYRYHGGNDIRKYLEFEAHVGSVNDLAFSSLTKKLCIITCGDDKLIKVWDVALGSMLYTFEGHSSPVSSVCPHSKENINYLFSTSVDGRIKAWLYDLGGTRVDYETPGRACTELTYSADGKRLFSCGTSKEGESHVIEWNEAEGTVKRAYQGFSKNCETPIQFGITKNRYLAAGDDHSIKVWDIDNENMLTMICADEDLPASPRIRFNKDGSLLAVSANNNKIKILATVDGIRLLSTNENHFLVPPRPILETAARNGVVRKPEEVKQRPASEEAVAGRDSKVAEITEPSQLRFLRLTTLPNVEKISRLLFSNTGYYILALASNGTHLVWKWPRVDPNVSIKVTTNVAPRLMSQPASGNIMSNDLTNVKPENAVSCIALSKNDSYVLSASGGKITLFNMMSSKTMAKFMAPVPAAMCLVFHPQDNNVVAIGMDDSTILIYNVRTDEVKRKLVGHTKRITGLAFSNLHHTLISSGSDSQIVRWNAENWEMEKSSYLKIPGEMVEKIATNTTQVQFHIDQTHFLVTHEVQLSIHEATKLDCIKQWVAGDSSPAISQASFSSDCKLVYTIFLDGVIQIFAAANLQPQCLINPSAYLPANVTSGSVVPRVMAAHPKEANMLAVGLSDGGVVVLEPLETETKWGLPPATLASLPTPELLPTPAVAAATAVENSVPDLPAASASTSNSELLPMTIG